MGTNPNLINGQVLTAGQWNALFVATQDNLGFAPVNKAGDTMTGKLNTTASIAGNSGFSLQPGVAPAAPVNGDLWLTTTGIFAQVGGSSVQLASSSGTGVINAGTVHQLAWYASSGAAISGNPNATIFNGALTLGVAASIAGSVILSGAGSGGVTLAGPVAGGSGVITFPAGTIDFSASGGTSQVVVQGSAGGIFTVRRLTTGDLTNGTFTGSVNATFGYQVNGVALAASNLSNGVTGTGAVVLANSPTLITPTLGVATFTSLTGPTIAVTNGTSGSVTLQAVAGTLGNQTLSIPATTATILTTGSTGGTISALTVSLGSDVILGTGAYIDGPSAAQGTIGGTWLATATLTLQDTVGGTAGIVDAKLWDGTTAIASTEISLFSGGGVYPIPLSGVITNPTGNIKVSVRVPASTSTKLVFNKSGNSKDSTITVVRIN